MAYSIAATLLVHALLLWALGQRQADRRVRVLPPGTTVLHVWLGARGGAAVSDAASRTGERESAPPRRTAAARAPNQRLPAATRHAPANAAVEPAYAAVAPAAEAVSPTPVSGNVFALPTIGFGGGAARWHAAPPGAAMPVAAEQAWREQGRALIARALAQQVAALTAPAPDHQAGRCELDDASEPPALRCDSATLEQALAEHGTSIAALLARYRALDNRIRRAAVAFAEGAYRLELH